MTFKERLTVAIQQRDHVCKAYARKRLLDGWSVERILSQPIPNSSDELCFKTLLALSPIVLGLSAWNWVGMDGRVDSLVAALIGFGFLACLLAFFLPILALAAMGIETRRAPTAAEREARRRMLVEISNEINVTASQLAALRTS